METEFRSTSEQERIIIRPVLLIVLAVLCLLLIIADGVGLFDDDNSTRPAIPPPSEPVHFVRLEFAEPNGAFVFLDATQFDAAELRDAYLVTPVAIPFRMNAEYSVELAGIDGLPGGVVQIAVRTYPVTGRLVDVISQQVVSVNIDESLREHLVAAGTLKLVYFHSDEPGTSESQLSDRVSGNHVVHPDQLIAELLISTPDAGEAPNSPDVSRAILIHVRPEIPSANDAPNGTVSDPASEFRR